MCDSHKMRMPYINRWSSSRRYYGDAVDDGARHSRGNCHILKALAECQKDFALGKRKGGSSGLLLHQYRTFFGTHWWWHAVALHSKNVRRQEGRTTTSLTDLDTIVLSPSSTPALLETMLILWKDWSNARQKLGSYSTEIGVQDEKLPRSSKIKGMYDNHTALKMYKVWICFKNAIKVFQLGKNAFSSDIISWMIYVE